MPALRPTPSHSEFISVHDVRALLGNVSETFVRARLRDKAEPLPVYKLGGRLFFKRSEVLAWIDRQRVTA